MRNLNLTRPPSSTTATGIRRRLERGEANGRLRPQLVSEAVVAGYIHAISARHRRGGPVARRRLDPGQAT